VTLRQFCKIIGYKRLAQLALAVEREVAAGRAATSRSTTPYANTTTTTEPAATLRPLTDHRIATAKVHGKRDNLRDSGTAVRQRR
jgi:hypothetical protein